jgi:hypothetical protein
MTSDSREDKVGRIDDNGEEGPAANDVSIGGLLNLQPAPQIDAAPREK